MLYDQLFRTAFILLFIWSSCFSLSIMEGKLDYLFYGSPAWFMVILITFFSLFCFQPCFKCGYRTARMELLISLFEIAKSPFGRVRFRDFFLADVLTSMGVAFNDFGYMIYYFFSPDFYDRKRPENDNNKIKVYLIIVSILPFWFRFWQCIRKFYNSEMKIHLVNALKYFSKIVPPVILAFTNHQSKIGDHYFWLYMIFQMIATLYCLIWDYYMDWGLLRSWNSGTYMLRDEIRFPQPFYYFAMLTNLILRFWWVIGIFTIHFSDQTHFGKMFDNLEVLTFINMMAEAIRRTQWTVIRVENEFFNNFEQYRTIPTIPNLMD